MSLYTNIDDNFFSDQDLLEQINLLQEFEADGYEPEETDEEEFNMEDDNQNDNQPENTDNNQQEENTDDAPPADDEEEFNMDDEEGNEDDQETNTDQNGEETQEESPEDDQDEEDFEIPDEDENNDAQENDAEQNDDAPPADDEEEFDMDDANTDENPGEDNTDAGNDNQPEDNEEDNVTDSKLKDLESVIFDDLSDEEKKIKLKELKELYISVYKKCSAILELITDIKRDEETNKIVEYISNTLIDLKQYINDYINDVFDNRTYVENLSQLQKYIMIFNAINKVFAQIKVENDE